MSPMTGRHAEQDVLQTARSVRETSRRGCLAWAHEHAGIMGATARPGTTPGAPAPPLGARPGRRRHVQGVADRARGLAPVLGPDADMIEAAAWLHDIGYAPSLATTGLHQLDGARYLRDAQHADAMLCRLVAHHSCAIIEAGERGLADILSCEFDPAPYALSSMLTCCDMTTSPDGEPIPVDRRSPRYMTATARGTW